ncbi:MCE family protein [Rhodococcus qingshengii]|uniref:MCE family protein n=1 Tax=Rhodococcus qingshengii TaxID=334542 RepID=UPI00364B6072
MLCAIGILVAVCTACTPASLLSGRNPLSSDIVITAEFDSAAGLYPGNEISILGVPVGEITTVEPSESSVEIGMAIDAGISISAAAFAVAVAPSVVTDRHIELTSAYAEGPQLTSGDRIPRERTKIPVDFDRLIASVDDLSSAFSDDGNQGALTDALSVANGVLDGNGQGIRETLSSLSHALKTGAASAEDLSSLIVHLAQLSSEVADNDTDARDFAHHLATVSAQMNDQSSGMIAAVTGLNSLTEELADLLARNTEHWGGSVSNLNTTLATLTARARELTEVVDVAPLTFENLANSVDPHTRRLRVHFLSDKSLLDTDLLNTVCQRLQMRSEGCRTTKLSDFGPDLGITALLMGLGNL